MLLSLETVKAAGTQIKEWCGSICSLRKVSPFKLYFMTVLSLIKNKKHVNGAIP
jgi:hypothetical protein